MQKENSSNNKVFVGLSGGVDSSVSLYLLKEKGFDVAGVFIKVWQPDFIECTWKEDREDAMHVCAELGVPFFECNLEEEYKKQVVDYMVEEYKKGNTPNPDVMCNKHIKFDAFFNWAMKNGADYVATGHYAQIKEMEGRFWLLKGEDETKDQSYFLWGLGQDVLSKTFFPVGSLIKKDVRKIAEGARLITARKKDSQGLCFIGKVDMKDFLSHYVDLEKGDVLNINNEVIGKHDGALVYTLGQRHGFIITEKTPNDKPYFVVSKDVEKNTITVSDSLLKESPIFNAQKVTLKDISWTLGSTPEMDKKYTAEIRYRQEPQKCHLVDEKTISFEEKQKAVATGQSLVLYDEDVCLGGGIIDTIFS